MKRLFAILLMLIIPLQFSYATAAAYCADERPSTPQHYGHHDHDFDQTAFKSDGNSGEDQEVHSECGICHHGCAKLHSAVLPLGAPDFALPTGMPPLLFSAQHQPPPPHRPPIASLA